MDAVTRDSHAPLLDRRDVGVPSIREDAGVVVVVVDGGGKEDGYCVTEVGREPVGWEPGFVLKIQRFLHNQPGRRDGKLLNAKLYLNHAFKIPT